MTFVRTGPLQMRSAEVRSHWSKLENCLLLTVVHIERRNGQGDGPGGTGRAGVSQKLREVPQGCLDVDASCDSKLLLFKLRAVGLC